MRLLLAIGVLLVPHQLYADIFDSAAVLGNGFVAMYESRIVESTNSPFTVVLDGGFAGNVFVEGNNTFEIRSGNYTDLDARDQSLVFSYGGSTFGDGVRAYDHSTITIFDGLFDEDVIAHDGTVNVHGGTFRQGFSASGHGTLNFYGTELLATQVGYDDSIQTTEYHLTGRLASGEPFLYGVSVGADASMILHTVPEPSTALLLLIGLPLIWRRNCAA
ncbi:MAG: PEP-CTERM sorting domain-containing protein [Planctomycetales bacterium]|nr:PEP-CTERM sorting domain-containing protein [Planctomycetales bacterium]